MYKSVVVALFMMLILPAGAIAQQVTYGPDWKQNGAASLTYNGRALTFGEDDLQVHKDRIRCVKMNNYGCIMGKAWRGAVGTDGAGHAVFSHPRWSVRAVVRDYCSKNRRGLKSALQIAESYTPWCDTLGTVAVRKGWGRTCSDGVKPSADFNGPLCKKPVNSVPAKGQCDSCNCPDGVARAMSASIGVKMDDDLGLFDKDGKPDDKALTAVLRSKFRRETGFTVSDDLLAEGIKLAGQCEPRT